MSLPFIKIEKPGHPPIVLDVQAMRDDVALLLDHMSPDPLPAVLRLAKALGLDPHGEYDDPDDDPDEFAGTGWPDRERAAQEPGGPHQPRPDDDPDDEPLPGDYGYEGDADRLDSMGDDPNEFVEKRIAELDSRYFTRLPDQDPPYEPRRSIK